MNDKHKSIRLFFNFLVVIVVVISLYSLAPNVGSILKAVGTQSFLNQNGQTSFDKTKEILAKDLSLNGLDGTLEKIREASIDQNLFLLNKYYSQKTLASFASSGGGRVVKTYLLDMTFGNVKKLSDTKLIIPVSRVEMSGHTETVNTIFVREKDGWKMGLAETAEYFK